MLIFASARRSPRAPPLAFRQHAAVHPACSPSREPQLAWALTPEMPASWPYLKHQDQPASELLFQKKRPSMRFWFLLAALMGPRFFRRFILLFALGMAVMFYCLIRS